MCCLLYVTVMLYFVGCRLLLLRFAFCVLDVRWSLCRFGVLCCYVGGLVGCELLLVVVVCVLVWFVVVRCLFFVARCVVCVACRVPFAVCCMLLVESSLCIASVLLHQSCRVCLLCCLLCAVCYFLIVA